MVSSEIQKRVGLVPAAGLATRLGIDQPKELLPIQGQPVINYSVNRLLEAEVAEIVVVIREGKESIRDHLLAEFPDGQFSFVFQQGSIGNLLDAIKASHRRIQGNEVLFLMADTIVSPNPFLSKRPSAEVTLLCFEAEGDSWRHFGVVSPEKGRIVDKPREYVGRTCWGALQWNPEFTDRLMSHEQLPEALNDAAWRHTMTIRSYQDIGTGDSAPNHQSVSAPER